jgi:DNA-binding response OmpR family regulator/anti-sigma regulatory factor (Ser/Thr protein kinase)
MPDKIKILLIEDEQYIRENMQELLEAKGYQVRAASNGKQGFLEAVDYRPHLILCDVMMPKMDGFKVLEQVRKTVSVQNTPFIFLTAKVDKNDVRQGMEMGADDYITKPFTAKELVSAIEARLKRHEKLNSQYHKVKTELDTSVFSTYYHEFNTPLHGIVGGLNLLISASKSFSEKQVHDLQVSILKSAIRLNHSLSNLMMYEEIKRAEVHPELESMFANGHSSAIWPQKIKDELFTIAREIYGRVNDIEVEFTEPPELAISLEYLLRIMVEITDNALKFSKSGNKIAVYGKKMKGYYEFIITDEGSGFPFNNVEDIAAFKQFNRKRFEQQGLGIGLHLVKQLVTFNSGELKIETQLEKGTKVSIKLPAASVAV